MRGKIWFAVAAFGAVVVYFIASGLRETFNDDAPATTQDDFYMREFRMTVYDATGKPEYRASGPDLRRAGDGSITLQSPRIEWLGQGDPPWTLEAKLARLDARLEHAVLEGDVTIERNSTPRSRLTTERAESHLPLREVHTDAAVSIVQGAHTLDGIGLRADLNRSHFTLLRQVRGIYAP
ncbi:MAG: LPS export ABC transporter periplasmic protein LptC [Thiotrichales bacterium]